MASADETAIADWFAAWDKLFDGVDFVPARELFDPCVIGFGTRMDTVKGLDLLERDQWRHAVRSPGTGDGRLPAGQRSRSLEGDPYPHFPQPRNAAAVARRSSGRELNP